MSDTGEAQEASPDRIRLQALEDFAADVAQLLKGQAKEIDPEKLHVSIVHGSFSLATEPLFPPERLVLDLTALTTSELLDRLDTKRREIIERWQKAARSLGTLAYRIEAPFLERPIVVDQSTDYRTDDADRWVEVERYIRGVITDIGGLVRPNAHVNLVGGGKLTVAADQKVLKDDEVNRLYKKATLRIRAQFNVTTNELREAKLVQFVDYEPEFNEAEFAAMTAKGAKAWRDVDSASGWVDDIRGG